MHTNSGQPGPAAPSLRAVIPPQWNALTERIIGCAMEVHTALGPGLLERIYEDALAHEFFLAGLRFQRQSACRVVYKGVQLSEQVFDLVVDDLVLVELKAVEKVPDAHLATLVSYLRASGKPLGLLINFHAPRLKDGIFRRINPSSPAFPNSVTSATSAFHS